MSETEVIKLNSFDEYRREIRKIIKSNKSGKFFIIEHPENKYIIVKEKN